MSNKLDQKFIEVDPKEILFLYENCDATVKNIIYESLKPKHSTLTKRLVDKELTKLKRRYDAMIINEARRVLDVFRNIKYLNN